MPRIKTKPLTVNKAWQGRRFKTPEYKSYETEVLWLLPSIKLPESPFRVEMVVGFSNKNSDVDNVLKPFLDILQKKYGFNDSKIYYLSIKKEIVPKGSEFIDFSIDHYEEK